MLYSTLTILILQIFTTSTVLTATTPLYFSSSSSPSTASPSISSSVVISPKSGIIYPNKLNNAILNFDFLAGQGEEYEIESLDLNLIMWKRRIGGQTHLPGQDIILAENLIPNKITREIKLNYDLKGICGSYELIRIEHRSSTTVGESGVKERSIVKIPGIYLLVDCELA